jgi:hypothetical protein
MSINDEEFFSWKGKIIRILNYYQKMTIKSKFREIDFTKKQTKSCCRLKRKKNNLCVHCQRYQIQEVVKSLVRVSIYRGCPYHHDATSRLPIPSIISQPLTSTHFYFRTCDFHLWIWKKNFVKNYYCWQKMPKMPQIFYDSTQELWRWKQELQERRERNLHGCNNDACNLIISIFKAKLLTPISFRNFFYINTESSLHLIYTSDPTQ